MAAPYGPPARTLEAAITGGDLSRRVWREYQSEEIHVWYDVKNLQTAAENDSKYPNNGSKCLETSPKAAQKCKVFPKMKWNLTKMTKNVFKMTGKELKNCQKGLNNCV